MIAIPEDLSELPDKKLDEIHNFISNEKNKRKISKKSTIDDIVSKDMVNRFIKISNKELSLNIETTLNCWILLGLEGGKPYISDFDADKDDEFNILQNHPIIKNELKEMSKQLKDFEKEVKTLAKRHKVSVQDIWEKLEMSA